MTEITRTNRQPEGVKIEWRALSVKECHIIAEVVCATLKDNFYKFKDMLFEEIVDVFMDALIATYPEEIAEQGFYQSMGHYVAIHPLAMDCIEKEAISAFRFWNK